MKWNECGYPKTVSVCKMNHEGSILKVGKQKFWGGWILESIFTYTLRKTSYERPKRALRTTKNRISDFTLHSDDIFLISGYAQFPSFDVLPFGLWFLPSHFRHHLLCPRTFQCHISRPVPTLCDSLRHTNYSGNFIFYFALYLPT